MCTNVIKVKISVVKMCSSGVEPKANLSSSSPLIPIEDKLGNNKGTFFSIQYENSLR